MKSNRALLTLTVAVACLFGGALGFNPNLQAADPESPGALRRHAAELQAQAQELEAAGRQEEAMRLRREVEQVRQRAAELLQAQVRERPDGARPEVERERVQRQERLMAELREHQRAGRDEEVTEIKREILRLRQEMADQPRGGGGPRFGEPRRLQAEPFRERRPFQGEDREAIERRAHHVEVAIENLHAAGLHDVAEELKRELGRRGQRFPESQPPAPVLERLGLELRELHAQLDEVRTNVRELRGQMEELHRDRR